MDAEFNRAKHLFLSGLSIEQVSKSMRLPVAYITNIFTQIDFPGVPGVCFGSKSSPYFSEDEALNYPVYSIEDLEGDERVIYNSLCLNINVFANEYQILNGGSEEGTSSKPRKSEINKDFRRKLYVKQVA